MSEPGRPAIDDVWNVYLFVEVERKRLNMNVRTFCERRATRYWGPASIVIDRDGKPVVKQRRRPLRGDALRRRYGKAQQALGLTPPPLKEQNIAINPRPMDDAREVVDRMVEEMLAAV